MSSSSTSSPERSVGRGVRGRGRADSRRGRVRGRAGARRVRTSTRSDERAVSSEAALQIVQSRRERMKEIINEISEDRMREILLQLVELQPSLIFDILEPMPRQPGGYHPPEGVSMPDWCICGKCREMPTEQERVCCEREHCLTLVPDFQVLVLDEGVLALARLYRQDVLVLEEGADIRKANRHAAYRQFVLWSFGRLGVGNRVVIPSCCVWKIRDKFPDPFGQYTGFIASRLV